MIGYIPYTMQQQAEIARKILDLVNKYPSDSDLGAEVRKLIHEYTCTDKN